MQKKLKAFTLAEVLVTLMIIGVIAAVTIPGLKKSSDSAANIAGMKKAYSTLSSAVMLSENENGPIKRWPITNATKIANEYLAPYLNVTKNCGTNKACYGELSKYITGVAYNPGGVYILLADGSKFQIFCQADHCHILFDSNGDKKPNMLGEDVIFFTLQKTEPFQDYGHNLTSSGVYYFGSGLTRTAALTECKKSGFTCGALIIMDGGKIKY